MTDLDRLVDWGVATLRPTDRDGWLDLYERGTLHWDDRTAYHGDDGEPVTWLNYNLSRART